MEEMSMEEQQQMLSFSNNDATHIAKGKRTKRLRLLSPSGLPVMTSSSSSVSNGDETIDHHREEEDMANCLILLAQGGNNKQQNNDVQYNGHAKKTTATKVGLYLYECKTCNRTFPSFQALGGHRASHKKPKIFAEEKKPSPPPPPPPSTPSTPPQPPQLQSVTNYEEFKETSGPTISLQMVSTHGQRIFNGNKTKIHECSICGSEFTSGQALGGHMRRHRASPTNASVVAVVHDRPRNILQLDLNLPAPEEDLRETKFQFMSAAPALVDCHY